MSLCVYVLQEISAKLLILFRSDSPKNFFFNSLSMLVFSQYFSFVKSKFWLEIEMKLISAALKNPAAVAVIVALILLVGVLSLFKLPIQLFPDIERPRIAIQTQWRAASPKEVESEILEPQEQVLKGIPGLRSMNAFANQGGGFINLVFGVETDMEQTLIEVIVV